jgi:ferredoxin-NADP reductase
MITETMTHLVTLRNRFPIAEGTMAFQFDKPANFSFRPGQWIEVTLLHPSQTDAEGNVRLFSIASAPHEPLLMVATRMRDSAFKRELAKMALETEIQIGEPGGDFKLHNNAARTAVFLAGGIGVTPVRSILLSAAHDKLPHRIYFLFCNRTPKDAPFLAELDALQQQNSNYVFVPTMIGLSLSQGEWKGESGYISKEMLSKYLNRAQSPVYYITGPPGMVKGIREVLAQSGVDEDDIRTEEFSGY